MSDYGIEPTEIEVGVYALRTFAIKSSKLTSIVQGAGHWKDGMCVAKCDVKPDDPEHVPPAEKCGCGIYAFFTVEELFDQYPEFAHRIIGVITAQGLTTIGTKGLKTAAARVVAWWCRDDDADAKVCAASCPGTRRYYDLDVMTRIYGLDEKTRERNEDGKHR